MYEIRGKRYEPDDAGIGDALSRAYAEHSRPLCCCRHPGIEMYIARIGEMHVLKRMPGSGERHASSCTSYEPPATLSGLGELLGSAIQTNVVDGITALKLDFALTRKGGRAGAPSAGGESVKARTDGAKLTMRGALHYLFDQAGLTRWSPAMEGKRNWWVVRKHLLLAAVGKVAKGKSLGSSLFIPEPFSLERKEEIAHRRQAILDGLAVAERGAHPLMLMVAEVKELGDGKIAKNLRIKHLPDVPFLVREDLYRRVLRRFEPELTLWNAMDAAHLITAATFGVGPAGVPVIEEMSLMVVDEHWLVMESAHEKFLLDVLVKQKRRFIKCLRYNLGPAAPLPSAILVDVPDPIALYITAEFADGPISTADESDAESVMAWEWNVSRPMPPLPASANPGAEMSSRTP